MKPLAQQYSLHVVDMRGMGRYKVLLMSSSGRPKFLPKSREETEDYLLQGFESWRSQNQLEHFILCGHSLGGYIAAKYAARHPGHIDHLILISPAGVWSRPPDYPKTELRWREAEGVLKKVILYMIVKNWREGRSPFALFRVFGRGSRFAWTAYLNSFPGLSPTVSPCRSS